MPRFKSISSLEDVCLQQIAQRFDYWARDYVQDYVNQGEIPLYIIGPFDELTSELTQKLLDTLVKQKVARPYQLHLLLNSRLESLDLSAWSNIVQDSTARVIAARCHRLKSLVLSNCKRISPQRLADIIRSIQKLKRLDLSGTKVTDQVLAVLGNNSPTLIELSLRGTAISDGGLACLAENPTNGNPGCKLLQKLDLSCIPFPGHCKSWGGVSVGKLCTLSVAGIAAVVNHCDNLEVLDCEDTYGVISFLHIVSHSKCATRKIKRLKMHVVQDDDSIHDLPKLFPHLVELCIEGEYNHIELLHLAEFTSLRKLSLHSAITASEWGDYAHLLPEPEPVFFTEGVQPLLERIGPHLTYLSLHYVPSVNFTVIGQSCPNLQNLSVEFHDKLVMSSPNADSASKKLFTSLKSFECIHANDDKILAESTINALCSVVSLALNLEWIKFNCLLGLNDDHFESIYQHNSLTQVKRAFFLSCDDITNKSINFLVFKENDLEKLSVVNCKHIWTCDKWVSYCEAENKALTIDFTEPPFLF